MSTADTYTDDMHKMLRLQDEMVERLHRMEKADETLREANCDHRVRTQVLLIVVGAVALMSITALVLKVEPQAFTGYLSPVVGMAGTVLGYWFGAAGRCRGYQRGSRPS